MHSCYFVQTLSPGLLVVERSLKWTPCQFSICLKS